MEPLRKIGLPILLTAIGVAIAIVLYAVTSTPSGKSPEQIARERAPVKQDNGPEMASVTQLQINQMQSSLSEAEKSIQTLYKNQKEVGDAMQTLNEKLGASEKKIKDQRAYIAMIYDKMLELELKTDSIGGGLSGTRNRNQLQRPAPNPLQGMDSLPNYETGVLPPLPE